jgi:hypothetical protein
VIDWASKVLEPNMQQKEAGAPQKSDPVVELLAMLESHRMVFLFCALANRHNPQAASTEGGSHERIFLCDTPGWEAMAADADNEGAFIFTHRHVLDQYAQRAISAFGPGTGAFPTTWNQDGQRVPIEAASAPYWTIEDWAVVLT